jgi:hypothetical protein
LEWQLVVANECDGYVAGAAEESPLQHIAGTGVWRNNYNGKRGRQPKNKIKTPRNYSTGNYIFVKDMYFYNA